MVLDNSATSYAHGVGPLPLPGSNLTKQPVLESSSDSDSIYSGAVADPIIDQAIHHQRLTPIKYCVSPEFHLTEASALYICQDVLEDPESYQVRLSRSYSTFRPFYSHLRNLIVGTALRRPIKHPENISQKWDSLIKNIDLEGHSLQSFAKSLFTASIDGGCCGVFVEYPEVPEDFTRADEMSAGYRPYFVLIKSQDILGWTTEVSSVTMGDETIYGRKLTMLRIRDEVREPDPKDEFNEIVIPAVRVYDFVPGQSGVRFRIFVQYRDPNTGVLDPNRYYLKRSGFLSIGIIPFVPVYGGVYEDYMLARPLLLDVARLNLNHWSVSADLANKIHNCAAPTLVITGVKGVDSQEVLSPGRALVLEDPQANAKWEGAPMEGIEAVMKHLSDLEASMEKLAAVAMMNTTDQAESGFSKLLDRAQSDSQLAVLVQSLEESLNLAIGIASLYWDEPSIRLTLSRDFVPIKLHSQQLLAYLQILRDKGFSHETFLRILEVGDVFDGIPDFSIAAEIEKVLNESLPLAQPGGDINGRQDVNVITGRRPGQIPELSSEPGESLRPSPAAA